MASLRSTTRVRPEGIPASPFAGCFVCLRCAIAHPAIRSARNTDAARLCTTPPSKRNKTSLSSQTSYAKRLPPEAAHLLGAGEPEEYSGKRQTWRGHDPGHAQNLLILNRGNRRNQQPHIFEELHFSDRRVGAHLCQ